LQVTEGRRHSGQHHLGEVDTWRAQGKYDKGEKNFTSLVTGRSGGDREYPSRHTKSSTQEKIQREPALPKGIKSSSTVSLEIGRKQGAGHPKREKSKSGVTKTRQRLLTRTNRERGIPAGWKTEKNLRGG